MEITMPTMPSDYYLELADQRRARGDGHTEPEQAAADFAGAPGGHPRSPIRRRNTAPPQTLEQQMTRKHAPVSAPGSRTPPWHRWPAIRCRQSANGIAVASLALGITSLGFC